MSTAAPPWPQFQNFKRHVAKYKKEHRIKHEDVAHRLDIKIAYLRNLLYGQKKPSFEFIQRAAALFECKLTEFIDDPGEKIAGEDASSLTPKRRFLAQMMFERYSSEDLTDEDAELLFQDFLANEQRLRAIKARRSENKP